MAMSLTLAEQDALDEKGRPFCENCGRLEPAESIWLVTEMYYNVMWDDGVACGQLAALPNGEVDSGWAFCSFSCMAVFAAELDAIE